MNYKNLSIIDIHNKLKYKEISVKELVDNTYKNLQAHFENNFLVTLIENKMSEFDLQNLFDENNLLSAIPYVTKDNISTKNILTTAGSKILSNYIPSFDATITKQLESNKCILLGKATLDELGMGGTGLFGFNGEVRHPLDNSRIVGGSSSGSAYAVSAGLVPFSTGTDTGDSIRKPASFNGIVGFKPTYGSISRFGVIPYAPSLDHVGFFTRTVDDAAILSDATFEYDKNDFTSFNNKKEYYKNINGLNKKIKFGFLKPVWKYMNEDLKNKYQELFNQIKKDDNEIILIDFDETLLKTIPAIYMMISFSEGVSTHSNLDGINFGIREEGKDYIEIMKKTRTKNFGKTVKKRFTIGSYQLKKENQEEILNRSKKVRRIFIEKTNELFDLIDILILPPSFEPAPTVKNVLGTDVEDRKDYEGSWIEDVLEIANFNGMPSITIPFIKKENLPIGINLNAKPKEDLLVLQAAKYLENLIKANNFEGGELSE
ncbi:aspartyl/glutamyl-tRNA amidotransferase subunit A [Spiroplasma gladiatoris]|uniref:Aspartyl/glutamyl-tRNA amidotransferase subunit A n=1 Tax=Spiroplasma gladiatoris TaxID=2143 RepID=A0A4P7AI13_9MOLU|nr:amidase family protein [Spiroplasma gladiatoris]QBQ07338.1 aspartyl/glutamyl-tRNA amidotransferase subunit A [Spiroplasma gladiatoris]